MLFTYVLASALAFSVVLGRTAGPAPVRITYETEDQIQSQTVKQANIMDVNDRSSNLKYVMAIQSSRIWSEIKKRSLTISTQPLNETTFEKSLEDLSDQELAQLKQVCHDGLKCVAVDQLLVLEQVVEPTDDGQVSVRTAITKITKVLTQYTTEYHENVYEYKEVQVSDDQTEVYQSVTTILEDNKELCQIDIIPVKKVEETRPKEDDSNSDHAVVAGNGTTVNYNTIGNININNGAINDATINIKPASDGDRSKNVTPIEHPHRKATAFIDLTDDKPVSETDQNNVRDQQPRKNYAEDNGTSNRDHEPATVNYSPEDASAKDSATPDGPPYDSAVSVNGSANKGTDNNGRQKVHSDTEKVKQFSDNTVGVENGTGSNGGVSDSDSNIVSAGDHNHYDIRKGMVEDGHFNNGNMKLNKHDASNRNKGTIKDSRAKKGIISIGTVNNGPVNYGTSNDYTNNGTTADIKNDNVQQYVTSIDEMYSKILNELAKH